MIGLVTSVALAISAPAVAQQRAPLGHAGRWITDASGRVVILHGVNLVYKLAPYAPDAVGFGADDAAFLAAHGFNSVRLGTLYVGVEPQPGSYDNGYLARIAATVRTLGRHGIYSLLDFHQDLYNERFQGEGEPAWSVQDDGLPAVPQTGFPGNYLDMPALERAFDHLWENSPGPGGIGLEDRYVAAWQHVAVYFRGNPYVIGDDLFNEPWPGSAWPTCAGPSGCPVFDQSVLEPFMHRVITAIHSVNPQVVAYYEPNVLFDFGAATSSRPGDANSGMSFHDYCLASNFGLPQSGLGAVPCETAEQHVFQNASAQSQSTGDALLLSEFGATGDNSVIERLVNDADHHMVGWDYWAYCGCNDPTGSPQVEGLVRDPARPPSGANVDSKKLAVLERPYPQAVAGTPIRFSYDSGANVFRLTFTTARASGHGRFPARSETDVYVPSLHYPTGYSVTVTGAVRVSGAGASILRLLSCPGARRVAVRVSTHGRSTSNCSTRIRSARRRRAVHRQRARRGVSFTG